MHSQPNEGLNGLSFRLFAAGSPSATASRLDVRLLYLVEAAVLAFSYFVAARLGLMMALVVDQVSPVWPATGIALAAILLRGYRVWPAITMGAFAANLTADTPLWTAGGIAAGNTLEAVVGVMLLRCVGFRPALERLTDVLALAFLAAMLSTTISATIGTMSLCLGGLQPWSAWLANWGVWWLGDALGALVVAPVLLTGRAWPMRLATRERQTEALGLLLCTLALSTAVLAGGFRTAPHYPLNYGIFPVVIWAALRFGQPGSSLVCLAASTVAIFGTFYGYGPFVEGSIHEGLIHLQMFMVVLAATGLLIAAAATEREQVQGALRDSQEGLKLTLHAANVGTWCWNKRTREVHWSTELEAIHGLRPGSFGGSFDDFLETVHWNDRGKVLEAVRLAMETSQPYTVEYRSQHADGTIHWMEGRGSVLYDAHGVRTGMRGTCMDVTSRKNVEEAVMAAEARQIAMLEASLDGIITADAEGNIVQFNAAAERIFGRRRQDTIGRPMAELLDSSKGLDQHEWSSAEPFDAGCGLPRGHTILVWARRGDGSEFPAALTLSHVESGGSTFWTRHVRDLSESERAQRYLNAEHAVAGALATASGLADAAPSILETLCQTLAWDVGAFWLVDSQARVLRCVEHWHRPGLVVPRFEQACREAAFPRGVGLPGRIWDSGETAWIFDVAEDGNFPRAPIANQEGLHSAVGFPISQGDEFLGVMEFFSRRIRPPDEELLGMLTNIAGQISHFIERQRVEKNLHKRQQEMAVARKIQQRLLPKSEPGLVDFDIAAGCRPAQEVGGDFFDFLHLSNNRLAIGIGDATGHGIGAAMLMAHSCACLRTATLIQSDVEQILNLLNRRLLADTGGNGFVTLLLACLDPGTRQLLYSSAGHMPGYVFDAQGTLKQVLHSTGFPLATLAESHFPMGPAVVLEPGDLLFLLTDGIVEAFSADGAMFGIQRTLDIVRAHRSQPAREIVEALWRETDEFCDGPQMDDMTAVIVKAHAGLQPAA